MTTLLTEFVEYSPNKFFKKQRYLDYYTALNVYVGYYQDYLKDLYYEFNRDLESQNLEPKIPFQDFCEYIFDNSKKVLIKNI